MKQLTAMNSSAFVISRRLKAPRARVWEVYTQTDHLQHWFAPKGVSMSHGRMDMRVGGTFHYSQVLPDGNALWGLWQFLDIQEPHKIVLLQHFSDPQGGVARNPWNAGWPLQTRSTTTFSEENGGTVLHIEWAPINASPAEQAVFDQGHDSMQQGWSSVLDRLEEYLAELSAG
jgi:uncharacterized protein YndB with AHSA1/START domain